MEKNGKKRVSVLMPTFNQENYVTEAIQSVLDQTYPFFELIVINDGSTDRTRDILERFDHPSLKIIHQDNKKTSESINLGFRVSDGDYITIVSSDNLMKPDMLEICVAYLEHNPATHLVYTDFENIDKSGTLIDYMFSEPYYQGVLQVNPGVVGISFLFTRSLQKKVGFFRDYICNDLDYWLRAARDFSFGYIPRILSSNRKHEQMQTMAHANKQKRQVDDLLIKEAKRNRNAIDVCMQDYVTRLRRTGEQFVRAARFQIKGYDSVCVMGQGWLSEMISSLLRAQGIRAEAGSVEVLSDKESVIYFPLSLDIQNNLLAMNLPVIRLDHGCNNAVLRSF